MSNYVKLATLKDVHANGYHTVSAHGHTIALIPYQDQIYAIDNRCPHLGFPMDRGTVRDGIILCHWHHARFDLRSGGTFDLWADDLPTFPVEVRGEEVWVNVEPPADPIGYQRQRLQDGLERNLSLVVGKAVITLEEAGDTLGPFTTGLLFGSRYRNGGWGQGLTMHVCLMNMLPHLDPSDRARALYHGLSAVAQDTAGSPPRFTVQPLPGDAPDFATLKGWFRQFVQVRDDEGAERCVVSALHAGASQQQMADMLFAAVTDHRYIDVGHPLDFTNKALESLDTAGWEHAEPVLTSLVRGYAMARRMEESNAWRTPVDLIDLLKETFSALSEAVAAGREQRGSWTDDGSLTEALLNGEPQTTVAALLAALRAGATEVELAQAVAYAAALRIARFHTSNEFSDWDTALHTFTFANAVHQGLRRLEGYAGEAGYADLLRGVFDGAMSIYLDRFLNVPAVRLPQPNGSQSAASALLAELDPLLNRQQQVNPAGALVAHYLYGQGDPEQLLAGLGNLLLREDRNFHTIQCIEAAFNQYRLLQGKPEAIHVLVAAARYLAAHAPTMRAQGQTYRIASRLHRGERLFEGEEG